MRWSGWQMIFDFEPDKEKASNRNAKILIIADGVLKAKKLKKRLGSFGLMGCDIASSEEDALLKVKEIRPELVLMDNLLDGETDGVRISHRINEFYKVPIVHLLPCHSEEILKRIKCAETYGYLLKPFSKRELQSVIEFAVYRFQIENWAREKSQILFEDAPNPILILDENFCCMDANKSAMDFLEAERIMVIGKKAWEFFPQLHKERPWDSASPRMTTEINYLVDKSAKTILLSMVPLTLSGKKVHYCIGNDITQRKVLEKELMENSEREQRRFGQELHDDLGQLLAGIAFMAKALEGKLEKKSPEEAHEMAAILSYINQATARTQSLARGMFPVQLEAEGLMSALRELSSFTGGLFETQCAFLCDSPVLIYDNEVAIHLYRIAQEAIRNAVRHGQARHITVELSSSDASILLRIQDDGKGIPEIPSRPGGLGLSIMRYRAASIGATLDTRAGEEGGTVVTCVLPIQRLGAG